MTAVTVSAPLTSTQPDCILCRNLGIVPAQVRSDNEMGQVMDV